MKLNEWGLMRHKPRKNRKSCTETREANHSDRNDRESESSTIVEMAPVDLSLSDVCEKRAGWQIVAHADDDTEPTFIGLLARNQK